jgi:uncharacterized membrane protein
VNKWDGISLSPGSAVNKGDLAAEADAATYAVVSIHVAHTGSPKLPAIATTAQVREALVRLSSELTASSELQALEIMWSPTLPTDTITKKDLFARYPELRAI